MLLVPIRAFLCLVPAPRGRGARFGSFVSLGSRKAPNSIPPFESVFFLFHLIFFVPRPEVFLGIQSFVLGAAPSVFRAGRWLVHLYSYCVPSRVVYPMAHSNIDSTIRCSVLESPVAPCSGSVPMSFSPCLMLMDGVSTGSHQQYPARTCCCAV